MVRLLAVVLLVQHVEILSDCGGSFGPPVNDPPATQVAMGGGFGCAVTAGQVRCWGANAQGQLGRGQPSAFEPRAAPVALDETIAQLALGETVACARTVTGRVWCWGDNGSGALGTTTPAFSATPVEVKVPVPVKKLAVHADFVLALGSDGRLFGWGNGSEGTLGRGDAIPTGSVPPEPVLRAAFDHTFVDVAAGQGHACGIDGAGTLWCWGRNTDHQLGSRDGEMQVRTPTRVLEGVTAVAAGAFNTVAISGGQLFFWGNVPIDDSGQRLTASTPTRVDLGGATPQSLDALWFHFCTVSTDARLFCWGRGVEGQLGLGGIDPQQTPREVARDVRQASVGFFHTCLLSTAGQVSCMGANDTGQLGLGDQARRAVPTPQ